MSILTIVSTNIKFNLKELMRLISNHYIYLNIQICKFAEGSKQIFLYNRSKKVLYKPDA